MENLCKIRNIQRAVVSFELKFEQRYGIGLNEGMALCSLLKAGSLSSGEIGELLGITSSNTSKVIASIEKKGLVKRVMGKQDKRQMYFSLTEKGTELISGIRCDKIDMSDLLKEIVDKVPV